ncbi:MAG: ASCH domain-containing protein, partial [Clostridia bacterium]
MLHNMRLKDSPFNKIKMGKKTIELRLMDEKRSLVKPNDFILFTNIDTEEIIETKVICIHKFNNFEELYQNFCKVELGYSLEETAKPDDMLEYYSKEEQEKYGVVGIEIKYIDISKIYNNITNDLEIIDIYKNIEDKENIEKSYAYHNYTHVLNVNKIIEYILNAFKYDENFIKKAKIAGILHDTGVI